MTLTAPRPAEDVPATRRACLEAFQSELDYIFATLRRLNVFPSDREDLAQEIFLALQATWSRFDTDRPLRPYLFGIMFRLTSAHQRKKRRQIPCAVVDVHDARPHADDALDSLRARRVLRTALDKIPLPRRAILIMHELDGVPMSEVARTLSIPVFTAYSRLRQARRELKKAVGRIYRSARTMRHPLPSIA